MNIFIITIVLISIAFVGIAIKIIVKKDGKFAGTCASQNSLINNSDDTCSICGANPSEKCQNEN
ncbi:MAG: membrane or secreted protein [Bacteroidota bacterium]|nr:membrane or secreted protein [Bacteroidota bacterium]